MTDLPTDSILARRFQAGKAFELVVFDRLPLQEQALLAELRADPELYGVLKPRGASGLTVKAVDRSTALLLLTLREPGPLPFFALEAAAEETAEGFEQLVLDGVLEVEIDGRFVSGPAAAGALSPAPPPGAEPRAAPAPSRLAEISLLALRHGERADLPPDLNDPQPLAALLYSFNREPLSPGWAERLPDADAVLDFLNAAPGTPLGRRLAEGWEFGERESSPGWIVFQPRRPHHDGDVGASGSGYKLYVSPQAAALPAAFEAVVEALLARGGGAFKVGSDAAGVLRPDKLVLYFRALEELLAVARGLEGALRGLPAQGVPFSAPIDAAGLLSWGVDPPASERSLSWQGPESWRQWVVLRLAASLLAARATATPEAPAWSYALERLRREGVDVNRWTPSAALWAAA